ncbi:MAG: leucine-rich repeat domain-containing protein [Prevotella sp.]|nr:leucine-rich repeat domain-containing protein [Prevotella sp.]
MKRIHCLKGLCSVLLLLCAAQADADDTTFSATNTWTDGDGATQTCTLYYDITSDNTVMVTKNPSGSTYSGAIVIPETVTNDGKTYTVTGVEDYAFELSTIKSVDLSNVSTIGKYSFSCCQSLDSLTIGSKITEIPAGAFYGNGDSNKSPSGVNKIKYLTIPSQITSIGDSAFHSPILVKIEFAENSRCAHIGARAFSADDVAFTEEPSSAHDFFTYYKELDIPESVTFIGDSCFWGSANLEKITLHDGLDSIGTGAFSGYEYDGSYESPIITEITIPSTVTFIGDSAFQYTPNLRTVTYNAAAVKNVSYPFGSSKITGNDSRITKLVIGPKVREIPAGMFYYVTNTSDLEMEWNAERCEYLGKDCLKHVTPGTLTIGEDVKELYTTTDSDGNVLEEPVGLFCSIDDTGLDLKSSLTTLNFNAKECTIAGTLDHIPFTMSSRSTVFPLATVNFGDSVKIIPAHLLNGGSCYVQKTGSYAGTYYNAFPSLTTINLPASVETVGDYAFNYCAYLTSISFNGTNLKTIGNHAFANCRNDSLTSISLPSSLETIGNNAFDSCQYVAQLNIPASVTCIGDSAFHYCTGAESITFGGTEDQTSSLTSIGDYAFAECSNENLTTITLPNALETIGKHAFDSIPNVATLTIPAKVTSIGDKAFANWTMLATLTYNAVNCTTAGSASGPVFDGSDNFKKLTIGKDVEIIPTYLFNQCAALDTVVYNPTNCTSVTTDYEYPTFKGCSSIANVTIGEGVTKVPDRLFDGYGTPSKVTQDNDSETAADDETDETDPDNYGFANFKSLTLPSSLTSIGDYAFRLCTGLDTLNIQEGITTVGSHAFESCTGLDTLTISASLSSLGDSCFYNCTGLSTVYENRPLDQLQSSDASTIDATDGEGGSGETTGSTGVPAAGTNCFANTPQACWLVVPEDAAEIYGSSHRATQATADGWATINHMREATITVSLTNKDGYITRYSPYAYNTADNLQGLIVTGVGTISTTTRTEYTKDENGEITDSTTVTTITGTLNTQNVGTDGKDIPAGTAVLLQGATNSVGTQYVNYTHNDNSAETATIDDDVDGTSSDTGCLHGTVDSNVTTYATVKGESSDVSDSYYFFTLSLNSKSDADSHGFYWMNANGTPFTASPDKAWLALSKSLFLTDDDENTEVKLVLSNFSDEEDEDEDEDVDLDSTESIDGDETTTGISSLSSDTKDAVIYNMAGLRVNDMSRPGIYIVGGKKVVKK